MDAGELYEIYGDESATHKGSVYMVYGGLCIAASKADGLRASINKWKATLADSPSEFHWSSLSAARLRTYKEFVRGGVHHAKCKSLMFRSIVFEKSKLNWKLYHGGDGEFGFYGLWFQFLMNAFMDWIPDGARVRIILDERSTSHSLDSLKARLNNAIRERNCRQRITVVNIEPRDSATCHFLQMADLVTGAVSHQHNRHRVDLTSNRGKAKESLANYSAELIGVESFTQRIRLPFFEVWPYRLQ